MADKTFRERLKERLTRKLRMTVLVDKSIEPLFTIRFNLLLLLLGISTLAILLIAGVTMLIAFTGLREYIPGYPTGEERSAIISNLQKSDSLINELERRDLMLRNLRFVLSGDIPDEYITRDSTKTLSQQTLAALNHTKSKNEEDFLNGVENAERYDVSNNNEGSPANHDVELDMAFFFSPIKGIVTNHFGELDGHMGTDVAAPDGTPIMSPMDGTIFFSEWTLQTGHVIMIQHDNELVSVSKHCQKLLKKPGDRVSAGEAVAITGNSGELTTAPHLHFELWYKGMPLNPENYINFEPERAK